MRVLSDRAEILRAATVLLAPGQVVELRALDAVTPAWRRPHTVAGYYDDWELLASAAAGLSARGVYVTLNPVLPALLARAANKMLDVGLRDPLAGDADIVVRRWLPIDCDPVRPAGISASDEEHAWALDRARRIRDFLSASGWPEPLLADSGNGAHLLYRVDLPADDGALIREVLACLAGRFDDARVTVDQKVFNPGRIWKLYGTVAAKGDHTPARPHRVARIIEAPDPLQVVAAELLHAQSGGSAGASKNLAPTPLQPRGHARAAAPVEQFDLVRWIERYRVPVGESRPWGNLGARRWEFPECPWNPAHKGSAYIVRQPDGALGAGCHHNSCQGNDWHALRRLIEGDSAAGPVAPQASTEKPPYVVEGGRMFRVIWGITREGEVYEARRQTIADFHLRIVEESRAEDGRVWFTLAGATAEGRPLRLDLPVEDFASGRALLSALTGAAGARATVRAGMETHLRPAIQLLTGQDVAQTRCYTRTGWADVAGRARFLMPGRQVDGLEVKVRKLPYAWPDRGAIDAETLQSAALRALESALRSLDPCRTTVIAALLFQAPLGKLAGWMNDRYAVFISGRTGSLKTSLAQTLMCLYGAGFASDQYLLKLGEGATRNAILAYSESANDMVLFVDNFKPNTGDGCRGFVNLLHNQVEGGGRERLNARSELQTGRSIECWPLFTGEDVPASDPASLARVLVVPLEWPGGEGVQGRHNALLADAQAHAAALPWLGAAWIEWLETDAGRAAAQAAGAAFIERRAAWAERLARTGRGTVNPLRVASNLASNELTWEVVRRHPLLGPLADSLADDHRRGLELMAGEMARQTAESLEAARFLEVLGELLASGECVVGHRNEELRPPPEQAGPHRTLVGWRAPDGGIYLLPDIALRETARVRGAEWLNGISNEALYAQLEGMGCLASHDAGRRTRRLRMGGALPRVLHLTSAALAAPAEAGLVEIDVAPA